MKKIFLVILLFLLMFFQHDLILAESGEEFVTIVNPVRISRYNPDPAASLVAQYSVISKYKLPATWLLTYDAIRNDGVRTVLKRIDKRQETGIFLEITPELARDSGVTYHNTGYWHHANSVFLSGYAQDERIKMIDKVFETFKDTLGIYPDSVGAWWIDSYSLNYMKGKYGITGVLGCSDQFSTDGYQIWGQPWMMPYYPTIYHFGIPAKNVSEKIDVVKIQWAPRDPLWGYESSLYSTQDYFLTGKKLDESYFEKLVRFYSQKGTNDFGQVTVGLEADLSPEGYSGGFNGQMQIISRMRDNNEISVYTMREFSSWYRRRYLDLSPEYKLETRDLLGSNKKVSWYQSNFYRISYVSDPDTRTIVIRDLRFYPDRMREPNFLSPNYNNNLSIMIPPVFDQVNYSEDAWKLPDKAEIETYPEKIIIKNAGVKIPNFLSKNRFVDVVRKRDQIEILPNGYSIPEDGLVVKDLSVEAKHFFKQKKFILELFRGWGWENFKKIEYIIPQEELYALSFLYTLPKGAVLIFDNECLQCNYHTSRKPLFVLGNKNYVSKFSKHPVVYNKSVFEAKTREIAKKEFDKTGVKYVYLVKFEDYKEALPFSPGDLGVERIYANANAEIWRVK